MYFCTCSLTAESAEKGCSAFLVGMRVSLDLGRASTAGVGSLGHFDGGWVPLATTGFDGGAV